MRDSIKVSVPCWSLCTLMLLLSVAGASVAFAKDATLQPIREIIAYHDADYGFSMAVPASWQRIIAEPNLDESDETGGYAVGFESPRSTVDDDFADYIMVEFLPGTASGAFAGDPKNRETVLIDGRTATKERIELDQFDILGNPVNLVVFQAHIVEVGYTVGIYAIGEQAEEDVLSDAFKLILHTLSIPVNPFEVS